MIDNIKISVITVSYNSEKTIEDTLKSVLSQTYQNYEHIVIDGLSSDNTVNIVKKYEPHYNGKLTLISEKDNGSQDALNKGIKLATGDLIGLINSDDYYCMDTVFEKIAGILSSKHCDGIYSNLLIVDCLNLSKVVRKFIPGRGNYKLGWIPPTPVLFLKKYLYDNYGYYDNTYKIAGDYDFFLRLMTSQNLVLEYIPETFVHMRTGGVSTNGLKHYIDNFKDAQRALESNKVRPALIINIMKTLRAMLQFRRFPDIVTKK